MQVQRAMRIWTIIGCLGLLFFSGCANFLKPEIGAIARKEYRITLDDGGAQGKIFEVGDIRMTYSYSGGRENLNLTGTLVFKDSLTNSYPSLMRFFLYLDYLDDSGKVMQTNDITPVISRSGTIPDSIPVNFSGPRPQGSKAIVFHYFGVARGNHLDTGGQWELYHFPFN